MPDEPSLFEQLGDEVRASQRATDIVDELVCEILGVNRTDARCLDILDQYGRMTAGALALASALTTGAITAVADRLERAGYVRRVADPQDRRRVLIELTSEARRAADELMREPMAAAAGALAERFSEDELRVVLEFTRAGREMQERHAEWLRERQRERARDRAAATRTGGG